MGVKTSEFSVQSMGAIKPRTSQLDPDVPISVYPAPDVLKVGFLYLSPKIYQKNIGSKPSGIVGVKPAA
jgi:hypothetical protein